MKDFTIYAIVEIYTELTIKAKDFEGAVEKAKKLQVTDFCKIVEGYSDGVVEINGVYDNSVDMKHNQ